ncbi:uncharacterized protein LOC120332044 [Styela clava]
MKKAGMLKTLLYSALIRGLLAENINVCSQPTRSIGYKRNDKVSNSWTLIDQNCKFQNAVLLLRLAKMNIKRSQRFQCRGYLEILAYLESKDICEYRVNTCFVFYPKHSTCLNASIADACTKVIWTRMENILPITVKYSSKHWAGGHIQQFEIEIIYQSFNSSVDETTTVQPMSTTAQQSTVLSSNSGQVQAVSSERTLAILFGILLFIVLIILFAGIVS